MWRDILIILSFVFSAFYYFGLTPKRLSRYAKTTKGQITMRSRRQKVYLCLMIALTLVYIFLVIWKSETFRLADFLLGLAILTVAWCSILSDVWKLSERGERVVDVVNYAVLLPLLVATVVLSDLTLWQKLAYPLGGACIGIVVGVLRNRRSKKRKDRRPSEEGNE